MKDDERPLDKQSLFRKETGAITFIIYHDLQSGALIKEENNWKGSWPERERGREVGRVREKYLVSNSV